MLFIKGKMKNLSSQPYARLHCSLGNFLVKKSPSYPEGKTKGFFELKGFQPISFLNQNQVMQIGIEVELGQTSFDLSISDCPQAELPLEVMPTEDKQSDHTQPSKLSDGKDVINTELAEQCQQAGVPYPLPQQFKIDPSQPRDLIDRQHDIFRHQQGYQFQVVAQTWVLDNNVQGVA